MMKNKILTVLSFILSIIVLVSSIFMIIINNNNQTAPNNDAVILRLWQIDTFDGGKSSRVSYLKKIARNYEKKNVDVYILVTSRTQTSAEESLKNGDIPDMISYGVGVENVVNHCVELKNYSFESGNLNGKCFAYPWAKGGYTLFSLNEIDKDALCNDLTEKNAVISQGKNMIKTCVAMSEYCKNYVVEDSLSAYVNFLNGKYKYMFGSQRDIYRFKSRQKQIYTYEMDSFSDMYQYFSVMTSEPIAYNYCLNFLCELLSEESQKGLTEIGLMSVNSKIYSDDNIEMKKLESTNTNSTLSAFCDDSAMKEINNLSDKTLYGEKGSIKNINKYLYTLKN